MTTLDALVVGGGPAGSTAALLLAQAGWRVGIVEKCQFPRRKVCGEFISATTWPLLRAMDVAEPLLRHAGPAVRRVGVFAGERVVTSALPLPAGAAALPGRALGRERLDALLLQRAIGAGARCWQPASLTAFAPDAAGVDCVLSGRGVEIAGERTLTLRARLVIAAHGAWEPGPLPTQRFDRAARDDDLLGFKARFRDASLAADLMPLIAFPGGYGGLVNSGDGILSLSCCVRRDALATIRRTWPGLRAGDAVCRHIAAHCSAVAAVLSKATPDGAWLAAGPLATGIRGFGSGRIVAVGNAAAEAHPIVAEGISMAIQSAHLACAALVAHAPATLSVDALDDLRRTYARAYRRNFARRIRAAALFAHLFMRPATAMAAIRVLSVAPQLLTLGAHWSGKDSTLRGPAIELSTEGHR